MKSNQYDYLRYLLAGTFDLYPGPSFLSILRDSFSNWSPSSYCPHLTASDKMLYKRTTINIKLSHRYPLTSGWKQKWSDYVRLLTMCFVFRSGSSSSGVIQLQDAPV